MYRPEYPRPSFVRENWANLNGKWEFEIEQPDKDYSEPTAKLDSIIEVPFCPESRLSGIEHKDFMSSVWYRRTFTLTKKQLSGRVILHLGAVDYQAILYINGMRGGSHKGGYTPFDIDITDRLFEGENVILINARDDTRNKSYPSGKQSDRLESYGCSYTRTTGIWQTVWLEFINSKHIANAKITPFAAKKTVEIQGEVPRGEGCTVFADMYFQGELVASAEAEVAKSTYLLTLEITGEIKLWDVLQPNLYDITLRLTKKNKQRDEVKTYTAFRTVELRDGAFFLNGRPVFLRQILDQGFYPDGIYTAPSLEDIERDIDIAIEYGFNGARPHQKVFEEQYLYIADKKGYLIWGEFPSWGIELSREKTDSVYHFLLEWVAVLKRDYNHPSIIGWCPLNEVWHTNQHLCDRYAQQSIYAQTKSFDPYRPVIGSSGGDHYFTDIDDYHDYSHSAEELAVHVHNHNNGTLEDVELHDLNASENAGLMTRDQLRGLPIFLSEYGGIGYQKDSKGWGYVSEEDEKSFVERYISYTQTILNSDCMGMCYTQLTDVEQEQNGLVTYAREPKLSPEGIKAIRECNMSVAKVEKLWAKGT